MTTKKEIQKAIETLQQVLYEKFGDVATEATAHEGCCIEIRNGGVDVLDADGGYAVQDDGAAVAADYLADR